MWLTYGKHIGEMLYKNVMLVLLLTGLVTVSLVMVGNTCQKQQESQDTAETFQEDYAEYKYYWTSEALSDEEYYAYTCSNKSNLWYQRLYELNQLLWKEKQFQFYTCYDSQPICLSENMDEIFLAGYEDGDVSYSEVEIDGEMMYQAKALLVSEKFFPANKVKVASGRGFEEEDYLYEAGKKVPVLLGDAYQTYYKVGDTISANYLFEDMELQVIGFLEPENFYLSSINCEFVSVERYILLPAFQIAEETEFSQLLSLMELNGNMKTKLGIDKITEIYHELAGKASLSWKMNIQDPKNPSTFEVTRYSRMTKQVEQQFRVLLVMIVIFTIIALLLNLVGILEKSKYTFGVELLCGASYRDICLECVGFVASLLLISDIWACLVLSTYNITGKGYLLIQVLVIGIGIFASLISVLKLKKMQIREIIGGNE